MGTNAVNHLLSIQLLDVSLIHRSESRILSPMAVWAQCKDGVIFLRYWKDLFCRKYWILLASKTGFPFIMLMKSAMFLLWAQQMSDEVSPSGFILFKCEYSICPSAAATAAHLNVDTSLRTLMLFLLPQLVLQWLQELLFYPTKSAKTSWIWQSLLIVLATTLFAKIL